MISAKDAKRAARNASALIVASFLSKGILFGWQLLLAPILGSEGYGIYNTVSALLVIGAAISSFSMGLMVIRDVARDPTKVGRYWTAMLFVQTLLSIFAYIGINIAGYLSGYSDAILGYTALAGISIFVDLFGNMSYDLLIAREKMTLTATIDVAHIIVRILLAGLALAVGWGLLGVYVATIASGMGRSGILWWANRRQGFYPHWPLDKDVLRVLLVNSAPLALSSVLFLIYQHTDKLMTTAIIGEKNTGYLGPAFVISFGVVEILSTTVVVATYPMMSRYYDDGNNPTFGFMVEKLALFMLMMSLPIALTLSIFSWEITLLLFKEAFAPTAGILSIFIWYTLLTMVGNVFSKGMLIQNRQRLHLLIRVSGLVVNVVLNTLLLNQFRDARGAAVASVIAEALVLFLLLANFRAVGLDLWRIFPNVLRLVMLAVLVGSVMLLLKNVNVAIAMAGGLTLYAGGILFGGILQADEWDLLYRLVAAMPFGPFVRRYWKRDIAVNW